MRGKNSEVCWTTQTQICVQHIYVAWAGWRTRGLNNRWTISKLRRSNGGVKRSPNLVLSTLREAGCCNCVIRVPSWTFVPCTNSCHACWSKKTLICSVLLHYSFLCALVIRLLSLKKLVSSYSSSICKHLVKYSHQIIWKIFTLFGEHSREQGFLGIRSCEYQV